MAVPVAALAKIAAAALSDEDTRRKLGWIVAAICSPLILTLALICSLLSGSAEHNNSAVLLCFNGGNIPGKTGLLWRGKGKDNSGDRSVSESFRTG